MKFIALIFIVLGTLFLQLSVWYFLGIPEGPAENNFASVRFQLYVFAVTAHLLGGCTFLYFAWTFWRKRQ